MEQVETRSLGRCDCGENQFSILGEPLMRVFCHCEVCQDFNQTAFGDITLYRRKDIRFVNQNSVVFKAYTQPPMVQRGKCTVCVKPVIEYFDMPMSPKLTIVPSANIVDKAAVPQALLHMFYHRRQTDATDQLPKYSGYLKSQMGFMAKLVVALIKHRNRAR